MKNVFLILIFQLFWLISFSQQKINDKISSIFIPEKNKVIFQLYSNNNIIDSLVVEDVISIKEKGIYFELSRRCGSGCKLRTILLLQNKENKLIESLRITYHSQNQILYEGMRDVEDIKYEKQTYNISKINGTLKLTLNKNNDFGLKSSNNYFFNYNNDLSIYYTDILNFKNFFIKINSNNELIKLNGTYFALNLNDGLRIYINKKWYLLNFETNELDFEF